MIRLLGVAALLALLVPAAQAAPVLVVESLDGVATANLLGETRTLAAGDMIREREVLQTGTDGRLSLLFARHGLLELGADARLAIETLPAASADADVDADADDQRSLVSLERGYLRVLWTPTPSAARWPLVLFYGGHRSTLQPGEYFFERRGGRLQSCVAAGRLTVSAIAGDDIDHFEADACYELAIAEPARRTAYPQAHWEAVRRAFTTRPAAPAARVPDAVPASGQALARSAAPAAAPALAAVAGPSDIAAGPTPGWTLLIGSYADPANAEQMAARLRRAGYAPFTRVKEVDGRTWHSVQLRGLPSRSVAEAKAVELGDRLKLDAVRVVKLP